MEEVLPEITQLQDNIEASEAPTEVAVTEPTKSVKTFWERLDEVLNLNLQSAQMRGKVEELLEQFPATERLRDKSQSFLFQPDRVLLSSNDDVQPSSFLTDKSVASSFTPVIQPAQYFSAFRIRLRRALVNVTSIQLLSAVIPNAIQNIPDNSTKFFYHRLRSLALSQKGVWNSATIYFTGDIVTRLGSTYVAQTLSQTVTPNVVYWTLLPYQPNQNGITAWNSLTAYNFNDRVIYNGNYYACVTGNIGIVPGVTYWKAITLPANLNVPNYWDLPYSLQSVDIFPTTVVPESLAVADQNPLYFNRTFTDYSDLLGTLNLCATSATLATVPNDISFTYNQTLNKFTFVPSATGIAAGYFYFPAGYEDAAVTDFYNTIPNQDNVTWIPGYTLNLRLGFTWNGVLPDPFQQDPYTTNIMANVLYPFLRPIDPRYTTGPTPDSFSNYLTFNSYCDLVNTSCVRVYADCVLGSTQDSDSTNRVDAEGLLSIVPVNATNLGVSFYQNNFNNPLSKIPKIITEIGIRLVNDQGQPFLLPNSATVLLELAVDYD